MEESGEILLMRTGAMNTALRGTSVLLLLAFLLCLPCSAFPSGIDGGKTADMEARYGGCIPAEWGEKLNGIVSSFDADKTEIALTLDACGGRRGSGYDEDLIAFLTARKVSATLFVNARWIDANPEVFASLAANPLFEIENHGWKHKPCSVNGRSVYGIEGTKNISELVDEVELDAAKIEALTGRKPRFFRSGTAYYDEVAVRIIRDLGYIPVGYSVLGDAGATYNREQVRTALLEAGPGDIILCHMNHPKGDTAEGIMDAVPALLDRGFSFVRLEERLPWGPGIK